MTTDSTKYFCKRGAVSARLNLVDASLSVEYCYVNPYSYGGDPLNYIDPTGMWAIGLGLVVGWDNKSGWSFGVGAAADFEIIGANFSYTFNQDGSKSLNLGVNANIPILTPWVYLEINMGLGFSMNSYSGATLSTHGGLCVGYATACAGVETGGSLYWDRGGSFMGATVYAGVYASFGEGMARVSAGYEAGLFGMEGRGLYAGASAGVKGASLYASWAENGGWNYGGGYRFANLKYNSETTDYLNLSVFGLDFTLLERMAIIDGFPNFVRNRGYKKMLKTLDDNNNNDFIVGGHGVYDKIANKFVGLIDIMGNQYDEYALKEWLYKNGYKDGQNIILMSCGNAILAERLSSIMPGAFVTGASTSVIRNTFTGRVHLEDSGSWQTYQNGKLVGSVRDGFWD